MYDAEIAILVSEHPKFIDRIEFLLEYGLKNCDTHKVRIKLIKKEGHNQKNSIIEKYQTANIKFENIFFKTDEPAAKRFTYYLDLKEEELNNSRWFIFIDDDTVTDIDKTLDKLDEWFDWKEKAYASGELMNNFQGQEWDIANLMGKSEWYRNGKGPYHEWQICCLSQGAIKKILSTPESNRVIRLRSQIEKGWGDHGMGLAAKFAKIYPVSTNFLSANPLILESTFLSGWVTHFHKIYAHKAIKTIVPVMYQRKDGNFGDKSILLSKNETKSFIFLQKGGVVIENAQGGIKRKIALWTATDENKLALYTLTENEPYIFDFKEGSTSTVNNQTWTIYTQ